MLPIIIQFALIIAIIYFVMFRPQQKQRQTHEAALKAANDALALIQIRTA